MSLSSIYDSGTHCRYGVYNVVAEPLFVGGLFIGCFAAMLPVRQNDARRIRNIVFVVAMGCCIAGHVIKTIGDAFFCENRTLLTRTVKY